MRTQERSQPMRSQACRAISAARPFGADFDRRGRVGGRGRQQARADATVDRRAHGGAADSLGGLGQQFPGGLVQYRDAVLAPPLRSRAYPATSTTTRLLMTAEASFCVLNDRGYTGWLRLDDEIPLPSNDGLRSVIV